MRGIDRRKLSLLQRCLLAALLLHLALLVSFRYVPVAGGLATYVAREIGLVTINLNPSPPRPADDAPAGGSPSAPGDLPPAVPAGRLDRNIAGPELAAPPTEVPTAIPQAGVGREGMAVAVAPPRADPLVSLPSIAAPAVAPTVVPQATPIDVTLDARPRLQSADAVPQFQPAPSAARVAPPTDPQPARPAEAAALVPPPMTPRQARAGSLAVAPDVTPTAPMLPTPGTPAGPVPAPQLPEAFRGPDIVGPTLNAVPFAAAVPQSDIVPPATAPAGRLDTSSDLAGRPIETATAPPPAAAPTTRAAAADGRESMAAAPPVLPQPSTFAPVVPVPALVPPPIPATSSPSLVLPPVALPRIGAEPPAADGRGSPDAVAVVPGGGGPGASTGGRAGTGGPAVERPRQVATAAVPGASPRIGEGGIASPPAAVVPRPQVPVAPVVPPVTPQVSVVVPKIGTPEPLAQRSPEQRRPKIERLGGNAASERAVDRGLAYLARAQRPDGRWTYVADDGRASPARPEHDAALTGLAVLAFLAADHSPARDGPYRATVARGVDWVVAQQGADGDLRGPRELRGAGAARANMYDHGIATMAVAEAALMSGEERYARAATRAAWFICDAQNKSTGGWRYLPGEPGDTSVFGWQVMALHNAELLGFRTPPEVRERAIRYLSRVSSGTTRALAGYAPGEGPSPAMTAEALFCRVLLGQPLDGEQAREAVAFLGREMPRPGQAADLYYWYYASLSLSQLQANPQVRQAWDRWNERCRDALVATQAKGGDRDGSWTDPRWGQHGGTVFATALATLTLEVYYRYLPLQPGDPDKDRAAWQAAEPERKPAKPRGPIGPRFEPN